MTAPVTDALPYGARDLKLTQYTDAAGMVLGTTSVDLPYLQHLNFTEAEEFTELRGDDRVITTRGKGSNVNWDIEAGGISSACWAVLTGGSVVETGLTPNRIVELRKKATTSRPWFRADGKIISDSGGDILVRIYRCRADGNITSNFADGTFATTQVTGKGLPLLDDTNDLIYSIFRRETSVAISLTPDPNPIPSPLNVTVGTVTTTSAVVLWTPVVGATGYIVEYKLHAASDWDAAVTVDPDPVVANTTLTPLVANTSYDVRISATVSGHDGDPCPTVTLETLAH